MSHTYLLIDGNYFIHRTYHAIEAVPNSKGIITNAVGGSLYTIKKMINMHRTQRIAVVFDSTEPTFRHKLYDGYKGDRPPSPVELTRQIDLLQQLLDLAGICTIKRPGFEGDDIIGTLAHKFGCGDNIVVILTGDKDMTQLIDDNIVVEDPFRRVVYDRYGTYDRFGVYPEQIADFLALTGDKADGIKGLPGVGAKTAMSLLRQFGSIDNIITSTESLDPRMASIVQTNLESLKLDKVLTTIVTNIEIDIEDQDILIKTPKFDELLKLYDELEFVSMATRLRSQMAYDEFVEMT